MKINTRALRENLFILYLFLVAFIVRFNRLSLFPLNHDEVNWFLFSPQHWITFLKIPVGCYDGYAHPALSYCISITQQIFSDPVYILRIPTVVIGSLTVVLIYRLAKECYGKGVAFIAATFLCFLPWHIIQSRVGTDPILVPFFCCLLMLLLIEAIREKSNNKILAFSFLLSFASFYANQVAILFTPTALLILLVLFKQLSWLKKRTIILGVLIYCSVLLPLGYLEIKGSLHYIGRFMHAHSSLFEGGMVNNILMNIIRNGKEAAKSLFYGSNGGIMYGASLKAPLMVSYVLLIFLFIAIMRSFFQRSVADKLLLTWLFAGALGFAALVMFYQPRYSLHLMAPLLIFVSKGLMDIHSFFGGDNRIRQRVMHILILVMCLYIVILEIAQLNAYFKNGPTDYEECRRNSYGCKEAADLLLHMPDIGDCVIVTDERMTLDAYLGEKYRGDSGPRFKKTKAAYYVLWAPESHPKDYWDGLFSAVCERFVEIYGEQVPINTIYYPNGLPAINIYHIEDEAIVEN
jgi:4-amino-4-deoxy-L-arabinose transferase-like glycosyltransferase